MLFCSQISILVLNGGGWEYTLLASIWGGGLFIFYQVKSALYKNVLNCK